MDAASPSLSTDALASPRAHRGTLAAQTAWGALSLAVALAALWLFASLPRQSVEAGSPGAGAVHETTAADVAAAANRLAHAEPVPGYFFIVGSDAARESLEQSLAGESLVRTALREDARRSWVVVAATDEEAAAMAAILIDQSAPGIPGGLQVRVVDLRPRAIRPR